MKKNIRNIYTVQFRRKREGITNYRNRLRILTARKPRLVVRKSLNNIYAAIVEYHKNGDIIKIACHSSQLKKFGWDCSTGNIPTAYLIGFMIGKKAINANFNDAVLDIGMNKSVKGTRIYAVLAGALDAGLKIPHDKEILPTKDRIMGKHITDYNKLLKKEGLKDIIKTFEQVKKDIDQNIQKKVK
ncbi:50S ribosomal protein L18 [Candidatus Woesearchaeota archaeon]|nr:50S ribosomal protein L18 [Candidatus Woesearchaeota archaeon]